MIICLLDTASKDPGQPLEPLEPLAESSYKQSFSLYLSCSCILFYSICQRVGTRTVFLGRFFLLYWCDHVQRVADLTYGFTCAAASNGLVVSVLSSDVTGDKYS
jgi:hypothetical protein